MKESDHHFSESASVFHAGFEAGRSVTAYPTVPFAEIQARPCPLPLKATPLQAHYEPVISNAECGLRNVGMEEIGRRMLDWGMFRYLDFWNNEMKTCHRSWRRRIATVRPCPPPAENNALKSALRTWRGSSDAIVYLRNLTKGVPLTPGKFKPLFTAGISISGKLNFTNHDFVENHLTQIDFLWHFICHKIRFCV